MNSTSSQIVINLLRLGAFLTREGNRLLVDSGLNQQQFVVLNYINSKRLVNQKEICSSLLFEKSNVSKIIKKLVTLDLVESVKYERDSRISLLEVTKKGKQLLKDGNEMFNQWNQDWLKELSDEELSQALKSLKLLNRLVG